MNPLDVLIWAFVAFACGILLSVGIALAILIIRSAMEQKGKR